MLPSGECLDRDVRMPGWRQADVHHIDFRIGQQLVQIVVLGDPLEIHLLAAGAKAGHWTFDACGLAERRQSPVNFSYNSMAKWMPPAKLGTPALAPTSHRFGHGVR